MLQKEESYTSASLSKGVSVVTFALGASLGVEVEATGSLELLWNSLPIQSIAATTIDMAAADWRETSFIFDCVHDLLLLAGLFRSKGRSMHIMLIMNQKNVMKVDIRFR